MQHNARHGAVLARAHLGVRENCVELIFSADHLAVIHAHVGAVRVVIIGGLVVFQRALGLNEIAVDGDLPVCVLFDADGMGVRLILRDALRLPVEVGGRRLVVERERCRRVVIARRAHRDGVFAVDRDRSAAHFVFPCLGDGHDDVALAVDAARETKERAAAVVDGVCRAGYRARALLGAAQRHEHGNARVARECRVDRRDVHVLFGREGVFSVHHVLHDGLVDVLLAVVDLGEHIARGTRAEGDGDGIALSDGEFVRLNGAARHDAGNVDEVHGLRKERLQFLLSSVVVFKLVPAERRGAVGEESRERAARVGAHFLAAPIVAVVEVIIPRAPFDHAQLYGPFFVVLFDHLGIPRLFVEDLHPVRAVAAFELQLLFVFEHRAVEGKDLVGVGAAVGDEPGRGIGTRAEVVQVDRRLQHEVLRIALFEPQHLRAVKVALGSSRCVVDGPLVGGGGSVVGIAQHLGRIDVFQSVRTEFQVGLVAVVLDEGGNDVDVVGALFADDFAVADEQPHRVGIALFPELLLRVVQIFPRHKEFRRHRLRLRAVELAVHVRLCRIGHFKVGTGGLGVDVEVGVAHGMHEPGIADVIVGLAVLGDADPEVGVVLEIVAKIPLYVGIERSQPHIQSLLRKDRRRLDGHVIGRVRHDALVFPRLLVQLAVHRHVGVRHGRKGRIVLIIVFRPRDRLRTGGKREKPCQQEQQRRDKARERPPAALFHSFVTVHFSLHSSFAHLPRTTISDTRSSLPVPSISSASISISILVTLISLNVATAAEPACRSLEPVA